MKATSLIGAFILAHGMVHTPLALAPDTKGKVTGWMMDPSRVLIVRTLGASEATMRQVGTVLMILSTLAFLGLYWHPWLVFGAALDLAVLLAVILRWAPAGR